MDNNSFSLKKATIVLQHKAEPHGLYVEDVLATFGSRSPTALILMFTLPFIQPVPLVGLSTPIGSLLILFAFFLIVDKPLWLPEKLRRKHLSFEIVKGSCDFLIKILNRTEKLIKPRMTGWASQRSVQILNGILIIIFAFLLALPLPVPFSNSIPAWFIVLNALGEIEEDGLLMWVSYLIALAGAFFFFGIGKGVHHLFEMF